MPISIYLRGKKNGNTRDVENENGKKIDKQNRRERERESDCKRNTSHSLLPFCCMWIVDASMDFMSVVRTVCVCMFLGKITIELRGITLCICACLCVSTSEIEADVDVPWRKWIYINGVSTFIFYVRSNNILFRSFALRCECVCSCRLK